MAYGNDKPGDWPLSTAGSWCGEFKPRDEPWPEVFRLLGTVCGVEESRVIVHCDNWQPKQGAYVEMRVVERPEAKAETEGT
jgi:hypothetical protein